MEATAAARRGEPLADWILAGRGLVHLGGLGRVDLTGALVLASLLEDGRIAGLTVEVVDVPPQAEKIIRRVIGTSASVSERATYRRENP